MPLNRLYTVAAGASEAITVANSAIPLTTIPNKCRAAYITVETAQIRYWRDGSTPSTTVGHIANIGDVIVLEEADEVLHFKAIRTGSTSGKLQVTYYT